MYLFLNLRILRTEVSTKTRNSKPRELVVLRSTNNTAMSNSSCKSVFPNLDNVETVHIAMIGTICIVLIPVTVFSNLSLITVLFRTNQVRNLSGRLIVCLSINDVCIGGILQPLTVAMIISSEFRNICGLKWAVQFLSYYFLHLNGLLTLTMAFERYVALKHPLKMRYRGWNRWQIGLITSGVAIALASAIGSVITATVNHYFLFNMITLGITAAAMLCIVLLYVCVYRQFKESKKEILSLSSIEDQRSKVNNCNARTKQDAKLAKAIAWILVTMAVCYTPYMVSTFIWMLCEHGSRFKCDTTVIPALMWSYCPVYANSILNVYIYSYNNRQIKSFLKKLKTQFTVRWNHTLSSES